MMVLLLLLVDVRSFVRSHHHHHRLFYQLFREREESLCVVRGETEQEELQKDDLSLCEMSSCIIFILFSVQHTFPSFSLLSSNQNHYTSSL